MSAARPAGADPDWPADAIEVGRIVDAWGLKGWIKVQPFASDPQALFSSRRWFIKPPEANGPKPLAVGGAFPALLKITLAKEHGDAIVAQAQEVADRNAAEALRGARVFVPRASFPTADKDEYYWVDLIGLAVVNREGVALGTVRELLASGPQTTLVLDAQEDGKPVERMVPFVSAFVDKVDLAGRLITVDWQPDY